MGDKQEHVTEIEVNELRRRLEEAEDTLRAIRNGEVDGLVPAERMGRRGVAGRQGPLRDALEIGDAGVAPPARFLFLDGQESGGLRPAFGIDMRLRRNIMKNGAK